MFNLKIFSKIPLCLKSASEYEILKRICEIQGCAFPLEISIDIIMSFWNNCPSELVLATLSSDEGRVDVSIRSLTDCEEWIGFEEFCKENSKPFLYRLSQACTAEQFWHISCYLDGSEFEEMFYERWMGFCKTYKDFNKFNCNAPLEIRKR